MVCSDSWSRMSDHDPEAKDIWKVWRSLWIVIYVPVDLETNGYVATKWLESDFS